MPTCLLDTSFVYSAFTEGEKDHVDAEALLQILTENLAMKIIIPWPIFYESLNTRLIKNKNFQSVVKLFNSNQVIKLDDTNYREDAFSEVLSKNNLSTSLVDYILIKILEDTNVRTDFFITKNMRDFYMFEGKVGLEFFRY